MKVLIVEDHPDMRDLLGRIVEGMGYVPVLASGGEEGLDKAIAEKPNLILLDMRMPLMDGREVARRRFRSWQQPRCFVLTTSTPVWKLAAMRISSSRLAFGIFRERFENC
jgi:CheY-like chemotaxis protein